VPHLTIFLFCGCWTLLDERFIPLGSYGSEFEAIVAADTQARRSNHRRQVRIHDAAGWRETLIAPLVQYPRSRAAPNEAEGYGWPT